MFRQKKLESHYSPRKLNHNVAPSPFPFFRLTVSCGKTRLRYLDMTVTSKSKFETTPTLLLGRCHAALGRYEQAIQFFTETRRHANELTSIAGAELNYERFRLIKDGHLPQETGKETWDFQRICTGLVAPVGQRLGERQRRTAWWARHSKDTANDHLVQTCLY